MMAGFFLFSKNITRSKSNYKRMTNRLSSINQDQEKILRELTKFVLCELDKKAMARLII